MEKKPIKRKMIASLFFDNGTAASAMDSPCVTIFWELENKENPFSVSIRYAMEVVTLSYPFLEVYPKLAGGKIRDFAKQQVLAAFPKYSGAFSNDINNEFHISEFGRAICAANTQQQIQSWAEQ